MTGPRDWLYRGVRRVLAGSSGGATRWVRRGLIPFVPLYRGARAANQLYRRWRRRSLPRPVVSVGNLRLGGTGKTAFVLWLVDQLRARDLQPAVLKRGTGRRTGTLAAPREEDLAELAARYGDEAALIHHRHPGVPVGIGPDRHARATELLENHAVDLFVLDDGFQRLNLHRDLDVVLLGSLRDLEAWELPAGPLREPPSSLRRADYVSLDTTLDDPEGHGFSERIARYTGRRAAVMTHAYRLRTIRRGDRDVSAKFRGRAADVLTTQARPGRFVRFLEREGIHVRRRFHHPDHASWSSLSLDAGVEPEDLLVTPKEWVKLPSELRGRVNRVVSEFVVSPSRPLVESIESLAANAARATANPSGEA